jgi:predicted dienelactone hydrolase
MSTMAALPAGAASTPAAVTPALVFGAAQTVFVLGSSGAPGSGGYTATELAGAQSRAVPVRSRFIHGGRHETRHRAVRERRQSRIHHDRGRAPF